MHIRKLVFVYVHIRTVRFTDVSRGTDSHYNLIFAGANLNLQFKFAPATTRVVAGRKPGENALAMDRSARRHDPFPQERQRP